jgi:hypothetical protein
LRTEGGELGLEVSDALGGGLLAGEFLCRVSGELSPLAEHARNPGRRQAVAARFPASILDDLDMLRSHVRQPRPVRGRDDALQVIV